MNFRCRRPFKVDEHDSYHLLYSKAYLAVGYLRAKPPNLRYVPQID